MRIILRKRHPSKKKNQKSCVWFGDLILLLLLLRNVVDK